MPKQKDLEAKKRVINNVKSKYIGIVADRGRGNARYTLPCPVIEDLL